MSLSQLSGGAGVMIMDGTLGIIGGLNGKTIIRAAWRAIIREREG
jgi:hypothetical protein